MDTFLDIIFGSHQTMTFRSMFSEIEETLVVVHCSWDSTRRALCDNHNRRESAENACPQKMFWTCTKVLIDTSVLQHLILNVFLKHVILVIPVVLRETCLTISVSIGKPVSMESEIVRVVSLTATKISEITQQKIWSSG